MKALYFLLATLLITGAALAQKTFIQDGKLNGIIPLDEQQAPAYRVVNTVEGVGKDELFKRARKWFVKTYNSPKDVLQTNDPINCELSGKGVFYAEGSYMLTANYPIKYLLSVETKEARYRITLSGFMIDDPKLPGPIDRVPMTGRKFYDSLFANIDKRAKALIASVEAAINKPDDF